MKKSLNILICPLQWGLGHASRIIPLAKKLHYMNNTVFIGAGEDQLPFFRVELNDFRFINFPGFRTSYSRFLPQYLHLLFKIPILVYHSFAEHIRLKKIINDYSIDIIISDNRFGLWNRNIRSVYITHMPLIPFPRYFRFLEFTGVYLHRLIMRQFYMCLIPDLPGEVNFSGRLSHTLPLLPNTRYIGILSRFTDPDLPVSREHRDNHITVILSGPEPQRTLMKQKLVEKMKFKVSGMVILLGRPGMTGEPVRSGNIITFNHLPAAQMKDLLVRSEGIITRSGYTTVMELISLGCTALLIPTPGQTEQEYLADYLRLKGWFTTVSQSQISKGITIPVNRPVQNFDILKQSSDLLETALAEMLDQEKNQK